MNVRSCNLIGLAALAVLWKFSAPAQSLPATAAHPPALPRRSSIILIVADGLGYGDLSCYGQRQFQTPNLDKLAAEGVRFTNYFAGDTNPVAAWAALMLGRETGSRGQRMAPELTVAQILQRAGYHTGLIGEWNLGDEHSPNAPWKKGFDEFAGYLNAEDAENFYADYLFRYAPHVTFDGTNRQFSAFIGREMLYGNTGGRRGEFLPDLLTKAALNFMKNNQPDWFNHYRPFFLVLNYKIPGNGRGQVPTDAPYSEEPWPQAERNRAAMIARLDNYVGQIRGQLDKLGMTNNAAIFFTSDTPARKSGGMDPAFFHSNISTNDLRVPMILFWPGHVPAGLVSGFRWSAWDFLPTAAEIGFAKMPPETTGSSILSADAQELSR
jgi:arylsulfatase A-like enzyme